MAQLLYQATARADDEDEEVEAGAEFNLSTKAFDVKVKAHTHGTSTRLTTRGGLHSSTFLLNLSALYGIGGIL